MEKAIRRIYLPLIVLTAGLLTFTAFHSQTDSKKCITSVKQVIKFNHALHKESVECTACHSGIQNSEALHEGLFPKKEDCSSCHDVNDDKNCTQCHYEDTFEPLQQKKYALIFSHKKHLSESAKCETCHAGIESDDGSNLATGYSPNMAVCSTCHNDYNGVTNACEACHTSLVNLVPQNHKAPHFERLHKFQAEAPSANCYMCHDNGSCEDCHNGTAGITENNTKTQFYHPYSGTGFASGTKIQKITRVHDLNFRFSHGMAVKGKEKECSSCHQTETFCVECHGGNNEDYATAGVMPSSHRKAGFVTIGAGTGGGQHALLAKRDIERCIACHDTEGSDPACIRCHTDSDGIRGTDSRTHKKGYLSNMDDGDWHSSSASLCYNCHTDANARPNGIAGIGFCGYCHGKK